jgi:hypothetical protein
MAKSWICGPRHQVVSFAWPRRLQLSAMGPSNGETDLDVGGQEVLELITYEEESWEDGLEHEQAGRAARSC